MGEIPAATAIRILNDVANVDAILLRGADSILRGEPQNDIDLFSPRSDAGAVAQFANSIVLSSEPTGLAQAKLSIKTPGWAQTAKVDIFHNVAWRGLKLADIGSLPKRPAAGLGIQCLARDSEIWLTVLKNALHGSSTPPQKLHDVAAPPIFPVSIAPTGWLRSRLDRRLADAVWCVAQNSPPDRRTVIRARFLFLSIRFIERPLHTVIRLCQWSIWRVSGRRKT